MEILFELVQKGKNLKEEIIFTELMQREIASEEAQYQLANEQMYERGIDGLGEPIGEYTEMTKQIKQSKGQRTDHMTLRDTEAFHSSIKIGNVTANQAEIDSEPIKSDGTNLLLKYGTDILEMTQESNERMSAALVDEAVDVVKSQLNL